MADLLNQTTTFSTTKTFARVFFIYLIYSNAATFYELK